MIKFRFLEIRGGFMNTNETVLITGASSGIGKELALIFAKNKYKVILVSRNSTKLLKVAEEIKNSFNCTSEVIPMDLSCPHGAEGLYEELLSRKISVDILINNAGVGSCGLFHQGNLSKYMEVLNLNITSLTILTKLISQDMVKAGHGKILNVASTGSYEPGPYIAVYYATKAYVLSLSQALHNELKNYGITVSALCPGATATEFSNRAGKNDSPIAMSPSYVAKCSYKGFMKGKSVIIPGTINKLGVLLFKLLPGKVSAALVGKSQGKLTMKFKSK